MSEPRAQASEVTEVAPGLWHWSVHDERIDFVGDSYALAADSGVVLIDPHRLREEALRSLGSVQAICLTAGSHQRASWRLRRELGVPVYAPALVREVDEEPDVRYGDGDTLPGDLVAHFTPGAGTTQHTLLRPGEPSTAFCPDLLVRASGAELELVSDEYLYDPRQARESVARLLTLPFELLCLSHGGPVPDEPKAAIRRLVEGV